MKKNKNLMMIGGLIAVGVIAYLWFQRRKKQESKAIGAPATRPAAAPAAAPRPAAAPAPAPKPAVKK